MRTVAIVNQKGGCGKTTTAINLAGVLARFGERTLLVDLDPQSHCSAGLAIPEDRIELHIGDAMLAPDSSSLDDSRLLWRVRKNLDLAPSSMKLAGLEAARGGIADAEDRDARLQRALNRWSSRYDMCLVDCPPSIGLLTFNALRAADEVLIPVETGFFSMQGAGRQINTIRSLARRLGGHTPYRLLVTMHDENSRLASDLLGELKRRFGDRVAPVVIRLDGKLKDAASMGQPVVEYAPMSIGAHDYRDLAAWLLGRPAPPEASDAYEPIADEPMTPRRPTVATPLGDAPDPNQTNHTTDTHEPAADPTLSRAAELAMRARQLLHRGAELQAKLQRDPDVARVMSRIEQRDQPATSPLRANAQPEPTVVTREAPQPAASAPGPIETSDGILFTHRAGPTSRVSIAGEFNKWSSSATPMRYNPQTGMHEAHVQLPPGRCEYRLVVDGVWIADPSNPSTDVNPFGETNSVVVVTRTPVESLSTEGAD